MSRSAFDPAFADLPAELGVFPLSGALLLPGGHLPLNIFEPRYLALVQDALGAGRMFGLIQPRSGDDGAPLYPVGCLARIAAFRETPDGRFLVTLAGVARFRVAEETAGRHGYRRVRADYGDFGADLDAPAEAGVNRSRLLAALKPYLRQQDMADEADSLDKAPTHLLLTSVAMLCPFEPREKQALLEAPSPEARAEMLITLLTMGASSFDPNTAEQ